MNTSSARKPANVLKNQRNGKRDILLVSSKLFAKYGFEGVTMRQIAKESNITLPSIYHHFGNKDELYRAVEAEMYSTHAAKLMDAITSTKNKKDNLRNFILTLVSHLEANPDYLKILQRALIEGWEDNQAFLVEHSMQDVFDQLQNLMDAVIPDSQHGPAPIFVFSTAIGFLTMRPITRKLTEYKFSDQSNSAQNTLIVDLILKCLFDQECP